MNAHDVRHLTICSRCQGLGDKREMLNIDGNLEHQECFVGRQKSKVKAILALPKCESDKLRLSVIGNRAMAALLGRGR